MNNDSQGGLRSVIAWRNLCVRIFEETINRREMNIVGTCRWGDSSAYAFQNDEDNTDVTILKLILRCLITILKVDPKNITSTEREIRQQ